MSDGSVVADTIEQARASFCEGCLEAEAVGDDCDQPEWVHPRVASPRVVTDDDPFAHEGAEVGDLTYDYLTDRADLRDGEFRVWLPEPDSPGWCIEPLPPDPVRPEDIPEGARVYHPDHGDGRFVDVQRLDDEHQVLVNYGDRHRHGRVTPLSELTVLHGPEFPPLRRRVTVAGRVVGDFEAHAADAACDLAVKAWVEGWKTSHPEYGPRQETSQ